jgi:hypothetical protein
MDQQVPTGTFPISDAIEPFIVQMGGLQLRSDLLIDPSKRQTQEIAVQI